MNFYLQLIMFLTCILTSCNSEDKMENVYGHEILVVTLNIEDNIEVRKVILISSGGTDSILGNQIKNKKTS